MGASQPCASLTFAALVTSCLSVCLSVWLPVWLAGWLLESRDLSASRPLDGELFARLRFKSACRAGPTELERNPPDWPAGRLV